MEEATTTEMAGSWMILLFTFLLFPMVPLSIAGGLSITHHPEITGEQPIASTLTLWERALSLAAPIRWTTLISGFLQTTLSCSLAAG